MLMVRTTLVPLLARERKVFSLGTAQANTLCRADKRRFIPFTLHRALSRSLTGTDAENVVEGISAGDCRSPRSSYSHLPEAHGGDDGLPSAPVRNVH